MAFTSRQLWPRVKFIRSKDQLAFSRDKKTVCGFILQKLHMVGNQDIGQWWEKASKVVYSELEKTRNNKTTPTMKAFMGKYITY